MADKGFSVTSADCKFISSLVGHERPPLTVDDTRLGHRRRQGGYIVSPNCIDYQLHSLSMIFDTHADDRSRG